MGMTAAVSPVPLVVVVIVLLVIENEEFLGRGEIEADTTCRYTNGHK
jgi:hypothetical protein